MIKRAARSKVVKSRYKANTFDSISNVDKTKLCNRCGLPQEVERFPLASKYGTKSIDGMYHLCSRCCIMQDTKEIDKLLARWHPDEFGNGAEKVVGEYGVIKSKFKTREVRNDLPVSLKKVVASVLSIDANIPREEINLSMDELIFLEE